MPQVIKQYQDRKKQIGLLERDVEHMAVKRANLEGQIQLARAHWLPQLEALIVQVNQRFSAFFKRLHCEGVVELERPDEEVFLAFGRLVTRIAFTCIPLCLLIRCT